MKGGKAVVVVASDRALDPYGGVRRCYHVGQYVYQGRNADGTYRRLNPINTGRWRQDDVYGVDAAAVQISSSLASPRIYWHLNDYAHVINNYQRDGADNELDYICMAGIFHPGSATGGAELGESYGHVRDTSWNNTQYMEADYCSQGGDSGAPVYSAALARGLHTGTLDPDNDGMTLRCGDPKIYSHIDTALRATSLDGNVNTP